MRNVYYKTNFNLEYPVLDTQEANDYLQEDDMTKYLLDSLSYDKVAQEEIDKVEDIYWTMTNNDTGSIVLTANDKLLPATLDKISEWVSGQCSDGLGEGFEQQPFASYENSDGGYYDEEDNWVEDNGYCMASFDWKTNKYKFTQVARPTQKLQESKGLYILKSNEFIKENLNKQQEFLKENIENNVENQITFGFEKNNPHVNIKYDNTSKENTVELEFRCYTEGNIKGFGKSGMPLEIQFKCIFNITFLDENNYDITLEENKFYCDNSDIVTPCCMSANICFGGINNIKNSLLAYAYKEDVERIFRIFPNPESLKRVSNDRITIFPSKETVDTFFDDCMTRFAEYIKKTIEENLNK